MRAVRAEVQRVVPQRQLAKVCRVRFFAEIRVNLFHARWLERDSTEKPTIKRARLTRAEFAAPYGEHVQQRCIPIDLVVVAPRDALFTNVTFAPPTDRRLFSFIAQNANAAFAFGEQTMNRELDQSQIVVEQNGHRIAARLVERRDANRLIFNVKVAIGERQRLPAFVADDVSVWVDLLKDAFAVDGHD